jgi:hypothetical protein
MQLLGDVIASRQPTKVSDQWFDISTDQLLAGRVVAISQTCHERSVGRIPRVGLARRLHMRCGHSCVRIHPTVNLSNAGAAQLLRLQ